MSKKNKSKNLPAPQAPANKNSQGSANQQKKPQEVKQVFPQPQQSNQTNNSASDSQSPPSPAPPKPPSSNKPVDKPVPPPPAPAPAPPKPAPPKSVTNAQQGNDKVNPNNIKKEDSSSSSSAKTADSQDSAAPPPAPKPLNTSSVTAQSANQAQGNSSASSASTAKIPPAPKLPVKPMNEAGGTSSAPNLQPPNPPSLSKPVTPNLPKVPQAAIKTAAASNINSGQTANVKQTSSIGQKPQPLAAKTNAVNTAGPVVPKPPMPPGAAPGIPGMPPAPPKSANAFKQPPNIKAPKGGPGAPSPIVAKVKKSPLAKFIPIILGGLVVLGIIVFVVSRLFGGGSSGGGTTSGGSQGGGGDRPAGRQVELLYWGLFEDPEVMSEVFRQFEQDNPGITVRYVKQSVTDYRERLQTEIDAGTGPDLFRFHASWVPMLTDQLSTLPSSVMTLAEYQETFYPVAAQQLQASGQIVGIPLMYDGLALFYNKEMLQTAGATVPSSWRDLQTLAKQLTVSGGTEATVKRGGLAVGNAENVEHFADILGLLILQNGGDPAEPNTQQVKDALIYYTNFAMNNPVYSRNLPQATTAFAREEVAMILAPSWRAFDIMAMNEDLDFAIAPAPKLADQEIAWANFWAEGVSSNSKHSQEAWQLLKYLSSQEVMQELYSAQKQFRPFGEIYARVDLADQLSEDAYVTAFLSDAPLAESWYMCSFTHDNGLNDENISYYADAITALLEGEDIDDVAEQLELAIKQNLEQYAVE